MLSIPKYLHVHLLLLAIFPATILSLPPPTLHPRTTCTTTSSTPTWTITSFTFSDVLLGGPLSSLSSQISISFTLTNGATGSIANCSALATLDSGESWDASAQHDCAVQGVGTASGVSATRFAFDETRNRVTVSQTWVCDQSVQFVASGSATIPLHCKSREDGHENNCDVATATVAGALIHSMSVSV